MANTVNKAPEDNSVEKAVWSYVGTGVLWISLLLTGIAFERLGISSNILTSILPGEVNTLRTQVEEQTRNIGSLKLERDNLLQLEGSLRTEISKLKQQISSAPAATPAP
ncbi:MAG: hypothetical protein FJ147_19295 [Deltaproteobacteria bacterium]|nr:hypothetical protein [Deltaproteobacteria bacterium]